MPLIKETIKRQANRTYKNLKGQAEAEIKKAKGQAVAELRKAKAYVRNKIGAITKTGKRGSSKRNKGVQLGLPEIPKVNNLKKGVANLKKGVKFLTKTARSVKKEGPKKTAQTLAKRGIAKGVKKLAYPYMLKLGKAYADNVPWIAKPLVNKAIIAGLRKAHGAAQKNFATEGLYMGLHDALKTARVGPFTGGALKLFNSQQKYKYDDSKLAKLKKLYTHMLRPADSDYIESGLMGSSSDGGSLRGFLPGALGRKMFHVLAASKGEGDFKKQLRELYGGSIVADYDAWNLGSLPDKEFENKLVEASIREHMHDKGKLEGGNPLTLFMDKTLRAITDIDRTLSKGKIPLSALKAIKDASPWS